MHLCYAQSLLLLEGSTTPRDILKILWRKYFYCHDGGSRNACLHPTESWTFPDSKELHMSHLVGLDIPGGEKPIDNDLSLEPT